MPGGIGDMNLCLEIGTESAIELRMVCLGNARQSRLVPQQARLRKNSLLKEYSAITRDMSQRFHLWHREEAISRATSPGKASHPLPVPQPARFTKNRLLRRISVFSRQATKKAYPQQEQEVLLRDVCHGNARHH
jgi:hypothetical protein